MADPIQPRTILIRSPNWVGDTVMAFPLVRALRCALPRARLMVLARPSVAGLWQLAGVDAVIASDDRPGRRWQRPAALRAQARAAATAGADAILLLPNTWSAALVARLAKIPIRIGYSRGIRGALLTRALKDGNGSRAHRAASYLGLLAGLDLVVPPLDWTPLTGDVLTAFDPGIRPPERHPRVGLAIGAVATSRRWPPDRFAALADQLTTGDGAWVALIGGPADRGQAQAVAQLCRSNPVDLTGRVSLEAMPSLLSRLDLLVANDSGAAHLAALAGIPCVVLFGAGDPAITAPLSSATRLLTHPVFCSPCTKNTCQYNLECLTGISVARVLGAAREALPRDCESNPRPRAHLAQPAGAQSGGEVSR